MNDPPEWAEILTLIMVIQTQIIILATPRTKGKHRKRKRYRRGKRQK